MSADSPPGSSPSTSHPTRISRPLGPFLSLGASSGISTKSPVKNRASHACDRCRLLRTKCSGGHPCDKCQKDDAICAFGDRKREKNKKDLAESIQKNEELKGKIDLLVQVLKNVAASANLDPTESANVRQVIINCDLATHETPSLSPSTRANSSSHFSMSSDQTIGGENYVDSSVGSPGHQDLLTQSIDIDLGRGTVGFIGKVSEISWITRAYSYLVSLDHEHPDGHANTSQRNSGTQLGYFMDDENLLSIDEDYVNALHWPGDMAVYILSEAFFHALQGIFDSFAREIFLEELRDFPRHQASFSWDQRRWLALTNLIWAIGSKWLHQAMLKDDLGIENHLVYYARARALGLDHRVMLDSQNFYGVKALGMLSFYLFINGSVNRAWALVGLAIRNATSLGLHLKVADGTSSPTQLIERARLWYSLYSLEVAMSEVFGKPPSISLAYTTVPVMLLQGSVHKDHHADNTSSRSLWLDFLRRTRPIIQTMSGGQMSWQIFQFIGYGAPRHHLSYRTRLSMISNQIMTQLYMPNQSNSWASVQKKIANLDIQLLDWHKSLPDDLDLESTVPSGTDPRAKIELALHYQSVRMILHRPCLCHIQILAESTFSRDFNYSNARSCVYGAVALVNILPDNPTRHEAYQLLPWWNLLHYLGQALAVFILELCLDMEHFEQSSTLFKPHIQKAMTYLECLTTGSLSAYKAWRILRQMLMALSFRVDDFDIANIALDAQVPAGWTDVDEATLMEALGSIGEVGS